LIKNLEHVKVPEKNQRLNIKIRAIALKMTSCRTMSKNIKLKKSKNPRFYGQNKLLFWCCPLQSLGSFSNVAASKSFSKNTRRMNIQLILNENSSWAHMELEFNMLSVAKKLVEYVVNSSKRKKKKEISFHRVSKK
jgi:hypothetical protein